MIDFSTQFPKFTVCADLLAKSEAKRDERAKEMLKSYMKKNYKVRFSVHNCSTGFSSMKDTPRVIHVLR